MQMESANPVDGLVRTVVRIECSTATGSSVGSGYFFKFYQPNGDNFPCIVTNKHVIKGSLSGLLRLTVANKNNAALLEYIDIRYENFEKMWIYHPESSVDLAIFPVWDILELIEKQNKNTYFRFLNADCLASVAMLSTLATMEEIIMLGYPNGLWDQKHNLPIIRRGVTATHPRLPYNGKDEFVIDAACFPGSSGSPVFLANIGGYMNTVGGFSTQPRIALLGTLYAGHMYTATGEIKTIEIPTAKKDIAEACIPMHLGLVISATKLLDFGPLNLDYRTTD